MITYLSRIWQRQEGVNWNHELDIFLNEWEDNIWSNWCNSPPNSSFIHLFLYGGLNISWWLFQRLHLNLKCCIESWLKYLRYLIKIILENWKFSLLKPLLVALVNQGHEQKPGAIVAWKLNKSLKPIDVECDYTIEDYFEHMWALLDLKGEKITNEN